MNFLTQFLNQRSNFYINVAAAVFNLLMTLFNVFVNSYLLPVLLTGSCFVFSAWVAITRWKTITGDKK